jgi:hypothetical protein
MTWLPGFLREAPPFDQFEISFPASIEEKLQQPDAVTF